MAEKNDPDQGPASSEKERLAAQSSLSPRARQPWLFPYVNPLAGRLGADFFRAVPRAAGVYIMRGEEGTLLYVGKAKCLRDRLASYRRARPGDVSRKVIRMIHLVRSIEWEECVSEEAALLRENEILRSARPPFNVVNTHPEFYPFLGLRIEGARFHLRLAYHPEPEEEGEELFGSFKSRGLAQRSFSALLRLLWAAHTQIDESEPRFEFPTSLTRFRPPNRYDIAIRPDSERALWAKMIRRFMRGTSSALLPLLSVRLLTKESLPRFLSTLIQEDLESLEEFYERGPRRNRALRRFHGIPERLIAQERIDDLIVTYRTRQKTPSGKTRR